MMQQRFFCPEYESSSENTGSYKFRSIAFLIRPSLPGKHLHISHFTPTVCNTAFPLKNPSQHNPVDIIRVVFLDRAKENMIQQAESFSPLLQTLVTAAEFGLWSKKKLILSAHGARRGLLWLVVGGVFVSQDWGMWTWGRPRTEVIPAHLWLLWYINLFAHRDTTTQVPHQTGCCQPQ